MGRSENFDRQKMSLSVKNSELTQKMIFRYVNLYPYLQYLIV